MDISQTAKTILTLIGGISWTIVYILIIIRSFRDKSYGMPFWALAFNFGWEFIFSFVLVSATAGLQGIINRVWLAFDVFILFAYSKYGRKEWPEYLNESLFYLYSIFGLITGYLFVYLMSVELDHSEGMYTAFIQNLMMSLLFIAMLKNRNSTEGQSAAIAFFKMIGSLVFTIVFAVKSRFVLFLCCGSFIVDLIYLILVQHIGDQSRVRKYESSLSVGK